MPFAAPMPVPPPQRLPRPIAEYFRLEAQMTARLEKYVKEMLAPEPAPKHDSR